jgi:hypothetical protein
MAQARPEPVFPVGFDEDALAEDLERLSEGAGEALEAFRKELRREGGISQSRLKACHDEGQDRTMLGGCVKTYIPWPDGRFGAVFVAVKHPQRPLALRAFAFGVRHHPAESNAKTVYKIADRRLRKKGS